VIEIFRVQEKERLATRLQALRDRKGSLRRRSCTEVTAIIREYALAVTWRWMDYSARFDGVQPGSYELRVPEETLHRSAQRVDASVLDLYGSHTKRAGLSRQQKEVSWKLLRLKECGWSAN